MQRTQVAGRGAGGQREQGAQRLATGIDQRAGLERAQPHLDALGDLGPRSRPVAGGERSGVDEDVGAVEVAARGARAGLGDVERPLVERLEERAHEVLGREPLDVLGVAQREGGLVGDGLQQLLVLGRERRHAASARATRAPSSSRSSRSGGARLDMRLGQLARRVEGHELERAVLAAAQPQLRRRRRRAARRTPAVTTR